MKYFDTQLRYLASHLNHFLEGSPSRDLIVNMVMNEFYDLHMANVAAMLISVEESSFNMYTKLLTGGKITEEDLKRRNNILAMGVFVYKEICQMIKYLSNDASISILREKDIAGMNEIIPPLEDLIQTSIRSYNKELPIFMIFFDTIPDTPEFKWEDVEIDESDTDFPIDPQKYLDVSDDFLKYYDDQISKHYEPDSYKTLANQNDFLSQCLIQKYSIPNNGADGDKK